MPSPKQLTAIFDIGKTNKKFLLFDENYAVVEKHQTKLKQTVDDDGDPCEDLEKLESWIRSHFQEAQKKYRIKGLNFSAYGASLVHIDKNGEPIAELYNYLKDFPENLLNQFYESVGGREKFSLETASPPMGMLNSGLQIYWLKHQKPEIFRNIKTSLHLPNYLSYMFSKKETSELTSIGCHTGLWNFDDSDYHEWVKRENVKLLLPSPKPIANRDKFENGIAVGTGIHDSSAALAPYLMSMTQSFMLISTGTWSITLNPFNDEPLTYKELEKDCLCYMDIYGNQVKASRIFLGAEYSHQKKKITEHFSVNDDRGWKEPNVDLLNRLIQNPMSYQKLELEKAHHTGPYPQKQPGNWQLSHFSFPKEAYHQLLLDLVSMQVESIHLVEGSKSIDKLIVSGGFSHNELYLTLLASFFPNKKIYTSKLSNASALGAAMVLNEKWVPTGLSFEVSEKPGDAKLFANEKKDSSLGTMPTLSNDTIEFLGLKKIQPLEGLHLNNYSWF